MEKYSFKNLGEFSTQNSVFEAIAKKAKLSIEDDLTTREQSLKHLNNMSEETSIKEVEEGICSIPRMIKKKTKPNIINSTKKRLKNMLFMDDLYLACIDRYPLLEMNEDEYKYMKAEYKIMRELVDDVLEKHKDKDFSNIGFVPGRKVLQLLNKYSQATVEAHNLSSTENLIRVYNLKEKVKGLGQELTDAILDQRLSPEQYMAIAYQHRNHKFSFNMMRNILIYEMQQQDLERKEKEKMDELHSSKPYRIFSWRQTNPSGNQTDCSLQLGISRKTVIKYWKSEF